MVVKNERGLNFYDFLVYKIVCDQFMNASRTIKICDSQTEKVCYSQQ